MYFKLVIQVLGGLAFFIFGMTTLSDSLQKNSSKNLKSIINILQKKTLGFRIGWTWNNNGDSEQQRHFSDDYWVCQCRLDDLKDGNRNYNGCKYWHHYHCPDSLL